MNRSLPSFSSLSLSLELGWWTANSVTPLFPPPQHQACRPGQTWLSGGGGCLGCELRSSCVHSKRSYLLSPLETFDSMKEHSPSAPCKVRKESTCFKTTEVYGDVHRAQGTRTRVTTSHQLNKTCSSHPHCVPSKHETSMSLPCMPWSPSGHDDTW